MKTVKQEVQNILKLAWPIILGNLSQMLIGLIDCIMIGQTGKVPLAAASFANAVVAFIIITSSGMSAVIGPLVSIQQGAGKPHQCGQVLTHGILLNFIIGLLFVIIVEIIAWNINLFEQPADVQPFAESYLKIAGPSILFMMLFNVCRQFSEGLSKAKSMLVFSFAALILNTFLNWLMIFGNWGFPAWGLDGAAFATLITRIAIFIALLLFLLNHNGYKSFLIDIYRWRPSFIRDQIRLGLPGSLQYASEAAAFTGATVLMGWVGTTALAAHQIVLNMAGLSFMVALGLSVAVSIRVGNAYGAGDNRTVRLSGFTGMYLSASFMGFAGILLYTLRYQLPALYIENLEVIELSAGLMVIAAFFQLFDGLQAVSIGALRGMTDIVWPTVITFIAYWVLSLPIGYLLAFKVNTGGDGVWWGLATGLCFSAVMLIARFYILTGGREFHGFRHLPLQPQG